MINASIKSEGRSGNDLVHTDGAIHSTVAASREES